MGKAISSKRDQKALKPPEFLGRAPRRGQGAARCKSLHESHGERVVVGQRLMQSASDLFLGWGKGANQRDFYVRQLRDMKMSAIIEDFSAADLRAYGRVCGWALARAHARSGDAAMIAGYIGSSEVFDHALCDFAVDYADQSDRDYKAFVKAVREGRIKATTEG